MHENRSAEASQQLATVHSEVLRGVSFFSAHLRPPAPIASGGLGSRMCLTTRPPHIAQRGELGSSGNPAGWWLSGAQAALLQCCDLGWRGLLGRGEVEKMGRVLGPGPGSMAGLKWLARVGPSPLDPWRYSMGWSEVAARSGAIDWDGGWLGRVPLMWGRVDVLRNQLSVSGARYRARAQPAPQPNWWAHRSACAWTAAWLTLRERRFLGQHESDLSIEWSERLQWYERYGSRKIRASPNFIAWSPNDSVNAIEVELARKSRARSTRS